MKTRWLTLAVGLALCLTLAPAALAEEGPARAPLLRPAEAVLEGEPGSFDQAALQAQPDYEGAIEALRQGIADRVDAIGLSQYHIPADGETIDWLILYTCYRWGELFVLDPYQQWRYRQDSGGTLDILMPPYRADMDGGDYDQARAFFDAQLQAIVDQIPQGFSDGEKVLFIHDYLAANYEYDYDFAIYDAYHFLRDGKGVCQAYMLTFSALMDRLGIPVSYVESELLNHAWNVVKVGDSWYHVDVTWDDPTIAGADVLGGARHRYFLLSDETNEALRRSSAQSDGMEYVNDQACGVNVTCTDRSYETGPWAQADSPMVYIPGDGNWYYISTDQAHEGLYRWSGDAAQGPERVAGYADWSYGVAPLVEYQGCLFFTNSDQLNRYELATGTRDALCAAPAGGQYSGLKLEEGRLFTKDRATGALTAFDAQLLPWREVDDLFSYYYNLDRVELKLGDAAQGKRFLLAWYDSATGRMKRLEQVAGRGSFGAAAAGEDLECTLFVLQDDGTLAPVRPRFPLKPQLTLD